MRAGPRTPRDPPKQPFWHQSGRHMVIFHIFATILHRISVRISPGGSRPLNLNLILTIFGMLFGERSIFGRKKRPCEATPPRSNRAWKSQPPGRPTGPFFAKKVLFWVEKNAPARQRRPLATGLGNPSPLGGPKGPKGPFWLKKCILGRKKTHLRGNATALARGLGNPRPLEAPRGPKGPLRDPLKAISPNPGICPILDLGLFSIFGFVTLRYWVQVQDGGLSFGNFYVTRSCEED